MISRGAIRLVDDLQTLAVNAVLERLTGKNLASRELVIQEFTKVKGALAGPNPTPLERLLSDRTALCWLDLQVLDIVYGRDDSLSSHQAEHVGRARERADRRFLAAARTLAVVRKIGLPSIQVNVGNHQVNVAGGA